MPTSIPTKRSLKHYHMDTLGLNNLSRWPHSMEPSITIYCCFSHIGQEELPPSYGNSTYISASRRRTSLGPPDEK